MQSLDGGMHLFNSKAGADRISSAYGAVEGYFSCWLIQKFSPSFTSIVLLSTKYACSSLSSVDSTDIVVGMERLCLSCDRSLNCFSGGWLVGLDGVTVLFQFWLFSFSFSCDFQFQFQFFGTFQFPFQFSETFFSVIFVFQFQFQLTEITLVSLNVTT